MLCDNQERCPPFSGPYHIFFRFLSFYSFLFPFWVSFSSSIGCVFVIPPLLVFLVCWLTHCHRWLTSGYINSIFLCIFLGLRTSSPTPLWREIEFMATINNSNALEILSFTLTHHNKIGQRQSYSVGSRALFVSFPWLKIIFWFDEVFLEYGSS